LESQATVELPLSEITTGGEHLYQKE